MLTIFLFLLFSEQFNIMGRFSIQGKQNAHSIEVRRHTLIVFHQPWTPTSSRRKKEKETSDVVVHTRQSFVFAWSKLKEKHLTEMPSP